VGWLWLLLGLLVGLILGVAVGVLVDRRRRRGAPVEAVTTPPPAPEPDAGYPEAVWALRLAERRVTAAEARYRAAEGRLVEAEHHASAREDEIDDLRDDLAAQAEEAERLRRERDAAEDRVAGLESELGTERATADEIRRSFAAMQRSTEAGREESTVRVSGLEEALDAARRRSEESAAAAAEAAARERVARERAERSETEVVDLRAEADRLRGVVRRLDEEASRATAVHAEMSAETEALRRRAAEHRRRVTLLEHQLAETSADAEHARTRLQDVTEAWDATDADRRAALERATAAEKELAGLQVVVTALTREQEERTETARVGDALHARIAELELRLRDAEAARRGSVAHLSGELERVRRTAVVSDDRAETIAHLSDRLTRERELREESEAAAEELAHRVALLESRLLAATDELLELDGLRTRLESLRSSLADTRAALVDVAGGPAAAEIERLRGALRAERDRSLRLGTRLTGPPDDLLRARIRELEDVIVRLETDGPDDLTLVRGIGPAIRDLLAEEGITTFSQLAAIDDATLERIRRRVPVYPERIERDGWIAQAAALAARRRRA
jgi:chromosome segregation ATPase